jgi:hypothetical protein
MIDRREIEAVPEHMREIINRSHCLISQICDYFSWHRPKDGLPPFPGRELFYPAIDDLLLLLDLWNRRKPDDDPGLLFLHKALRMLCRAITQADVKKLAVIAKKHENVGYMGIEYLEKVYAKRGFSEYQIIRPRPETGRTSGTIADEPPPKQLEFPW